MAEHANGGAEQTPATAVKDATAAPTPGGREVDFKKVSQPEAFKLLKARPSLPVTLCSMKVSIRTGLQLCGAMSRHMKLDDS